MRPDFFASNLAYDLDDVLQYVLARHILSDGDVVGALFVLSRRLVVVKHLGGDLVLS